MSQSPFIAVVEGVYSLMKSAAFSQRHLLVKCGNDTFICLPWQTG